MGGRQAQDGGSLHRGSTRVQQGGAQQVSRLEREPFWTRRRGGPERRSCPQGSGNRGDGHPPLKWRLSPSVWPEKQENKNKGQITGRVS